METRRTDWTACANGPWHPTMRNGGYVAYRIWTQTEGRRWFQRHEWKCADGTIEMDGWIDSYTGFDAHMQIVLEAEAA